MSTINDVQAQKFAEAEGKRYNSELKEMRSSNNRAYETEVKTKEAEIQRMRNDYETRIANLKNDQEQKLVEIRDRQSKMAEEENVRLKLEVENLKRSHQDQVAEIKIGQQNEIKDMVDSHKKSLEIAKQKFVKEKAKYDV